MVIFSFPWWAIAFRIFYPGVCDLIGMDGGTLSSINQGLNLEGLYRLHDL